jgi:hypothetical protein
MEDKMRNNRSFANGVLVAALALTMVLTTAIGSGQSDRRDRGTTRSRSVRTTTTHTFRNGGRTFTTNRTVQSSGGQWNRSGNYGGRPQRIGGGIGIGVGVGVGLGGGLRVGVSYGASDWRRYHPDWDGRYYDHNGLYFYDPLFQYPAPIDNEWGAIGAIAGGAAIIGALDDDPTLFFTGAAGALYSAYRYNEDLHSSDRVARLRASYFSRPYFYRGGVRYDRTEFNNGGQRYYQFVRH